MTRPPPPAAVTSRREPASDWSEAESDGEGDGRRKGRATRIALVEELLPHVDRRVLSRCAAAIPATALPPAARLKTRPCSFKAAPALFAIRP